MGVEDEVVLDGERLGYGFGGESGELYATGAARFPVLAFGEDFDGEDGVGAQFGVEKGEEVLGYGGFGNVRDLESGPLRLSHGRRWRQMRRRRTGLAELESRGEECQ